MKTTTEEQGIVLDAHVMAVLESLSKPIGTFEGTKDRILRIRNGQIRLFQACIHAMGRFCRASGCSSHNLQYRFMPFN